MIQLQHDYNLSAYLLGYESSRHAPPSRFERGSRSQSNQGGHRPIYCCSPPFSRLLQVLRALAINISM